LARVECGNDPLTKIQALGAHDILLAR